VPRPVFTPYPQDANGIGQTTLPDAA